MTKLLLPFNKTILKINIVFSFFLTILSSSSFLLEESKRSLGFLIIAYYAFWVMTGGFILSAFYFEISRKNEYYFYYNLGLGKIKLLILAYTFNFIFILPFLAVLLYV